MSFAHLRQFGKNACIRLGWNLISRYPRQLQKIDFNQCRAKFRVRLPHSVWIHGDWPAYSIEAELFLAQLRDAIPYSRYIQTTRHTPVTRWLFKRYPDDVILPLPWNGRRIVERFFDQLSVRLILLLRTDGGFPSHAYAVAQERQIPLVMVDVGNLAPAQARRFARLPIRHFTVWDEATATLLREAGCAPERITVTGRLGYERALQMPSPDRPYVREELGLNPDTRLVTAENLHRTEEEPLLDAVAWLKTRHPVAFLVHPKTPAQYDRLRHGAESRGLKATPYTLRQQVRESDLLLIDLNDVLASPFHDASDAVVAGGSFTRLPGISRGPLPVSAFSRVICGPYGTYPFPTAQVRLEQLADGLEALLSGAPVVEPRETMRPLAENVARRSRAALAPFLPKPLEGRSFDELTSIWFNRDLVAPPPPNATELGKWEDFRRALGPHDSILCLGNGPSSERPEVVRKPHDCLFRANHSWISRNILTRPKVVFVGVFHVLLQYRNPEAIFAFPSTHWASLQFGCVAGQRPEPLSYVVLEHRLKALLDPR